MRWIAMVGFFNALWIVAHSTQEKQFIAFLGCAFYALFFSFPLYKEWQTLLAALGFAVSLILNVLMFVVSQGCLFCFVNLLIMSTLFFTGYLRPYTRKKLAFVLAVCVLSWSLLVLSNNYEIKTAFGGQVWLTGKVMPLIKGDCPCRRINHAKK